MRLEINPMRVSEPQEKIRCHHCPYEFELSERDLRWIDAIILHGDIRRGEKYVRPPFNFGCPSCGTVFTYDYNPTDSHWKPEPPLQAFHVEQVTCQSCQSLVDVVMMSPIRPDVSGRKPWKQSWVEHEPWHRSCPLDPLADAFSSAANGVEKENGQL